MRAIIDEKTNQKKYMRLDRSQRTQHIVMIISFMTLVFTGLPVTFSDNPAASAAVQAMGGMAARALWHRIAAMVLIGVCVYHLFWTVLTERGWSEFKALLPKPKDLFDQVDMILYFIGRRKEKPKFDRFNFIEKFEYLAFAWGTVVMVSTGMILWFEEQAMMFLPKWAMDIAALVHSYEALLAFLAIIIWHFYHVHLNPEVFPMSTIWIDGMITEEELKHHHPLEYERIKQAEQRTEEMVESALFFTENEHKDR